MSPVFEATFQAATLSAVSNTLAQSIECYQNLKPFTYDLTPVIHFVLCSIISTPPNFYWQQLLESWFPAQVPVGDKKDGKKALKTRLSKTNTIKKFVIDQLIGGPVNNVLFLATMGYFRGLTEDAMREYIKQEFVSLSIAGLKLWPAVSLVAFSVVPAERRVVFGSVVALGWNVYLGLAMK